MRAEENLQIAAARYLDLLGVLWCHVANERQTSIMRGAKLKKMGVKPGVPDILIFEPRENFNGLAIELKIKGNHPTENQKRWSLELKNRGWFTTVVWNIDDFVSVVDGYLSK